MDFRKIEFDDDLDDMDAGELRELIQNFSEAHEANHETFKEVSDTVEQFDKLDAELTEKVLEYTSLSEESAKALSYSDKKSLLADFDEVGSDGDDGDDGDDDEGGEGEFSDKGTRGETHGESGTPEHVENAFSGIAGVQL